jgi:predicted permease
MTPGRFRGWFRLPLHRRDLIVRDLDAEIGLHLELRAEQLVRAGYPPDEARREALRRFGDVDGSRRRLYRAARRTEDRMRVREIVQAWWQDVSYAARSLVRERGFSAVVILTMAVAIGANAAMFGIIDRLLLRGADHVQQPDRVVRMTLTTTHASFGPTTQATFGYVLYSALRDDVPAFSGVAAYSLNDGLVRGESGMERLRIGAATWDFFPLLGVTPRLGRFFDESEDRPPQGERVAVLSHGLWTRLFSGDETAIGRTIDLDGSSYVIVGVAPQRFTGVELAPIDVWIPMSTRSYGITRDWSTAWNAQWLNVIARLAPGTTRERAGVEATAAFRRAWGDRQGNWSTGVMAAVPTHFDRSGKEPLETAVTRWLVGVALIVLLIACANVANLQLARGTRRQREVAVRLALGISRARLIRLLLVQSLLLTFAGALGGLVLANWGGALLRRLLLPGVQWSSSAADGRVLLFTLVVAVATGIITGAMPALQALRRDLTGAMRTGVREGGGRGSRVRSVLTVAQAALCVVLLVGAGLFLRSLSNVMNLDLGIEADRVLSVSMSWPQLAADSAERDRRTRFLAVALEQLRGMPQVKHAALAIGTPFRTSFQPDLRVPGYDSIPAFPGGGPYVSAVTNGYFEAVGVDLLEGRLFTAADRAGSEPVAIVNASMARALWPGVDPIGNCLHVGSEREGARPCSRIVGIVEDARRFRLREEPAMQFYIPFGQETGMGGTALLVRPRGAMTAAVPPLRRKLEELDGGVGFVNMGSLQETIDPQIRPWRLGAALFGLFGLIALGIAAVGLYSVIAYGVAQRNHELGVRMALGARAGNVVGMVLREALRVTGIGVILGVLLSLAAGGWIEPLLFEASARDARVYGLVAIVLLGVGLLAGLLPASRAARVSPLVALRSD